MDLRIRFCNSVCFCNSGDMIVQRLSHIVSKKSQRLNGHVRNDSSRYMIRKSSNGRRYTPSEVVDMSKERDWAAALGVCSLLGVWHVIHSYTAGMLDWDSTSIVFTKRSLLEFLK